MRKLDVPKIFVDEQSTRILLAALDRPRTAVQLSARCGIPIAICCYRVKMLEKRGLLRVEGSDGRYPLYRASMSTLFLFEERGVVKATFRQVDEETIPWGLDVNSQI